MRKLAIVHFMGKEKELPESREQAGRPAVVRKPSAGADAGDHNSSSNDASTAVEVVSGALRDKNDSVQGAIARGSAAPPVDPPLHDDDPSYAFHEPAAHMDPRYAPNVT